MKILLLGPVHLEKEFLKQKEKYPFLIGQGQQSWIEALEKLGHKVFVFRYTDSFLIPNLFRIYLYDFLYTNVPVLVRRLQKLMNIFYFLSLENYFKNQLIVKLANKFKPEVLFLSGGFSCIFPKTVLDIKNKYKCPVFLFSGINPCTSSSKVEKIMVKKGIVDIVIENDKGYAKKWENLGAKKVIVLPISSVDPKIHKKIELSLEEKADYGSDVCFVGTLTEDRQEILKQVQNDNESIELKIWGDIPSETEIRQELLPLYKGKAHGEKMVKIFNAAKIVLNFQPRDMINGGNMRTFEILGCGAFQLVDKVDQDWFVDGEELAVFTSSLDLQKKIKYYLSHVAEREKIAKAGYRKAQNYHTYEKHFKNLIP